MILVSLALIMVSYGLVQEPRDAMRAIIHDLHRDVDVTVSAGLTFGVGVVVDMAVYVDFFSTAHEFGVVVEADIPASVFGGEGFHYLEA